MYLDDALGMASVSGSVSASSEEAASKQTNGVNFTDTIMDALVNLQSSATVNSLDPGKCGSYFSKCNLWTRYGWALKKLLSGECHRTHFMISQQRKNSSLMMATIRNDTLNVLNMQHITPNSKRWNHSDIPGGGHKRLKDPLTWLKVASTLEKPPTPPTRPQSVD